MSQLQVDLKQVSQQCVVVKLPVQRVVLASHLDTLSLALLKDERVDHCDQDQNCKGWVDAKRFCKVVILVNKLWVLANL